MRSQALGTAGRVRAAAALLIVGLLAGPAAEHVYWIVGGTWGLEGSDATTGIRVVSAIVVVLVILGILVILARVGLWQQAFVSERAIRLLAWVLAVFLLGEGVAAFGRKAFSFGGTEHWELYGPVSLVLGLLALVVASSGGAWPRLHRTHGTLPSH
jgi:hypothetical protein